MLIVSRLGGFHTLMSFVGSIGSVMEGSGLDKALGCIYGKNTVKQMEKGKEIARGLRAHILVESVLMIKLQRRIVDESQTCNNDGKTLNKYDMEELQDQFQKLSAKHNVPDDVGCLVLEKLIMALE